MNNILCIGNKIVKRISFLILGILLFGSANAEIRVTTQSLKDIAIYPTIEIPASAISMNDSKISADVKAVVKSIPVLVGDTVKKGDVLVQLDIRDYKLNLQQAEVGLEGIQSRLKLAKYQLDQAKALFQQKAITDELLRQRQAEVTSLTAELDSQKVVVAMAKRNMEKCLVTAPFTAIVIQRLAQVGELANTGTPLVRIIDASRIEVSARIQPQDIKSLTNSKKFFFVSQNKSYPINLRKLTPAVDLVQRNQEARFQFLKSAALPGASGKLTWKQTSPHLASNLILQRNKQYGVFLNKNNKATFHTLNNVREGRPNIVDLPMDASIIIDGRFSLQDGDDISIDE